MLYQYVNQYNKIIKKVGAVFIISVIFIFILNYKAISDQSFYYYLFSTIVQGFLALVGVLSAAVVYKLQLIENDLNSIRDKTIPAIQKTMGSIAESYSWSEAKDEMKKILLVRSDRDEFKGFIKNIEHLAEEKGKIRNSMVDFFIIASFDVSMSLLGIPLSTIIILNNWHLFGAIFAIVNILISIYLLITAIGVARKIFGYSFFL